MHLLGLYSVTAFSFNSTTWTIICFFVPLRAGNASQVLDTVLQILARLGAPVAKTKTEGPRTCVSFLGILIDTRKMELWISAEKLVRLQTLLAEWNRKETCRQKDLESFLGHLSHAASVVRPGRIFLRFLFSLLARTSNPHHHIRLNDIAKADIRWRATFLTGWNECSFIPCQAPDVHVFSDASGSYGCGAFVSHIGWFQLQWPSSWDAFPITEKELLPIVIASALWGGSWRGRHICIHCDNMAVVQMLRAQTGRGGVVIHLLRCLSFFAARYSFHFSTVHIPGTHNTAAGALSRNHMSLFFSIIPQVPNWPIPPPLLQLLVTRMPDWGSQDWIAMFEAFFSKGCHVPPSPPTALVSANT